ncbi:glyoxylate reductase [Schizosaccharomyces pombe]|uniref:Putative 2-hydroxyacid dehydrogenase C1773.17c n=1 Tax=Schizosaccharomyces pombe (strain 972 / ATCC 24843) TaxID=284812 RepID=YGDH_SCHPO|nr:putative glyoxylate reductase [Schizosaccharomyces pombe]O94574.3 RecName: Full=Putative 2-hydroxyacid dehydrogenase C1773.17c [Schizosaccharomyces pombe 972h-]CAA21922.3 glyoxylate reductase (predicted) [Schizosaccharomyces pombe]|eukprot:NP_595132.2 putative glyoxylate reductase [Schizosaccharomyces pombe]
MKQSRTKRVLAIGELKFATNTLKRLSEKYHFEFIVPDPHDRSKTIEKIHEAASKSTFDACFWLFRNAAISPFTEEMLGPLLPTCKLFVTGAAGYNNVDVDWATRNGVYVANTPNGPTEGTANMNLMLFMCTLRGAREAEQSLRLGKWRQNLSLTDDPYGKRVGIIGMGAIGKSFAQKILPLGCEIVYHNRNRLEAEEEKRLGASFVSFDELLSSSDVISINCPLTPATHDLISTKEFEKMKDGVYIINTARGAIINEDAFIKAIKSGKVARAGLDVFLNEPTPNKFWLECDKVTIQPHCGVYTNFTVAKTEECVLASIETFLDTGIPTNPVNGPFGMNGC